MNWIEEDKYFGELLRSMDIEGMKKHFIKHCPNAEVPDDKFIEAEMRRMVLNRFDMTQKYKHECRMWLIENGY